MRTMNRSLSLLAAAAALVLWGSARAADFTLGFDGCPTATMEGDANADATYQLTGTLTSANITGDDGAQGWSFGVQITNGDFASFDTTVTVPTLYTKQTNPTVVVVEKDLVIDDAGFYSAELIPITGAPYNGFTTGIVFSTSKKQVLHPSGKVGTVHLNVHSTYPADDSEKKVTCEYKAGLQGSGQPVDNVVTFNSDSITPTGVSCEATLKKKVIVVPQPKFTLAFDGCPASTLEGKPGDGVTYQLTGTLKSEQIDGPDGAQGWSFGVQITNGDFASFDTTITIPTLYTKQTTPDVVVVEKDLVIDDAGFYSAELIPIAGAPYNGFTTGIVFSTSKKQVLHPSGTVGTVHLNVHSTYPPDGETKDVTCEYKAGLQGSGQPVDNVITFNSDSKTPETVSCVATVKGKIEVGPIPVTFRRGDANYDGKIDIADPIFVVYAIVPGLDTTGAYKFACEFAGDANKDGSVNLADAIFLIDYEFRGGSAPAEGLGCNATQDSDPDKCPSTFVCK